MEWRNLKEALEMYGEVLAEAYREQIADTNAFASGKLFDSVRHIVEVNDTTIELSLSLEEYWKWVEEGRAPGKFPPLNKIEDWISSLKADSGRCRIRTSSRERKPQVPCPRGFPA